MGKLAVEINKKRAEKYRKQGLRGDATLLSYWLLSVRSYPDKAMVTNDQDSLCIYKELDQAPDRLAAYLKTECRLEGEGIVSVQLPNWTEFTLIPIVCLRAGVMTSPLFTGLRESELIHQLSECSSKLIFIPGEFRDYDHVELAQKVARGVPSLKKTMIVDEHAPHGKEEGKWGHLSGILERDALPVAYCRDEADDVAIVLFVSGTESVGKSVVLTHSNLMANMKDYISITNLHSFGSMIIPVPPSHVIGLMYGVVVPFITGMASVLLERHTVDRCLDMTQQEKCTVIERPTVITYDTMRRIEGRPDVGISSLRFFYCGGTSIPHALVERTLEEGIKVPGVHGSTESTPYYIASPHSPTEKVLTTDGLPVPDTEIRVVGKRDDQVGLRVEGEELSKSPGIFIGYIDEPEMASATIDEEGWYHSGDLCIVDDDESIRITGRKRSTTIRGGRNISSVEMEDILIPCENIIEMAVVPYLDNRVGEKACVYLVLKDKNKPVGLAQVQTRMEKNGTARYE